MTDKVYVGNAAVDGPANRGWLLGHFMPEGDLRRSDAVEVKWGVHPPGDERAQWVTGERRRRAVAAVLAVEQVTALSTDPATPGYHGHYTAVTRSGGPCAREPADGE